ncbi:MAG: response regulator [Planctomycetes bacterium]|nr:response regulator [Planctomycetota bacterium]
MSNSILRVTGIVDRDGRIIELDTSRSGASPWTGVADPATPGHHLYEVLPRHSHDAIERALATVGRETPIEVGEFCIAGAGSSGSPSEFFRWVLLAHDDDRRCRLFVFDAEADRRRQWKQLCDKGDLLDGALTATRDGLFEWDLRTGETYYSPRFLEILSMNRAQFLPEIHSVLSRLHPDDVGTVKRQFFDSVRSTDPFVSDFRILDARGDYVWIQAFGRVTRDTRGAALRMVGSIDDRSREIQAQQQLRASREKFRLLFDRAPIGLVLTDLDGELIEMNEAFLEMIGRSETDARTLGWWQLGPTEGHEKERSQIDRLYECGCCPTWERTLFHREGHLVPVKQTIVLIEDAEGRHYIGSTIEDLTVQRRAERAKTEFLANISHEIRTPLTAIHGYLDLIAESRDEEDRERSVATIRRNAEHLLTIVDDLLDLSRIEADVLEIQSAPCSPGEILLHVLDMFRPRAEAKGLKMELHYRSGVPAVIETDPTRLRQILLNLVGNAVKFTEAGGIRVEVELDDVSETPQLQIDVIDTGVGIDPLQAEALFQPFSQADASHARRFGGTGLGLAICARLGRMLGGEVRLVDSEPDHGSRFRMRIATGPIQDIPLLDRPDSIPRLQESIAATRNTLAGRILVAEDGLDNQRLLRHFLEQAGAEVQIAENGRVAVESVLSAQRTGQPFDLILMDMQMPTLDGYGATGIIRQAGIDQPIIAVTAHAMVGDRDKCLAAGCDEYLTKPIHRDQLLAICRRMMTEKAAH